MFKSLYWQMTGRCKYCGSQDHRVTTAWKSFDEHMEKKKAKEYKENPDLKDYLDQCYSAIPFMPMGPNWNLKICNRCKRYIKWWR